MKNPNAVALGQLARGKPKNFSKAELARRRARIALVNRARMEHKQSSTKEITPIPPELSSQ